MPTPQLDAGANIAPAGHPEAVATAPTSSAETDCDDVVPCWCGEASPLYDDEGLDATCGGSGTLACRCGGDLCVCHHHGEVECSGCADCDESYEGDDEGAFEDGDEAPFGGVSDWADEDDDVDEVPHITAAVGRFLGPHDATSEPLSGRPGWCDRCSPDPCDCDCDDAGHD